jgi:7,8-dihydroneopterin aldolase/epimerase/oxygenase
MEIIYKAKIFAHHGWYDDEQTKGHWFKVEIIVEANLAKEVNADLANTFNYELIDSIVKQQMSNTQKLLETVIENIWNELKIHTLLKTTITIYKLQPSTLAHVERVGIKMIFTK